MLRALLTRPVSIIQQKLLGFRALGRRSVIKPPMTIWHKNLIEIGDDVFIGGSSFMALIEDARAAEGAPALRIGNRTQIGGEFTVTCAGQMLIEHDVLISNRVTIGDAIHAYEDPDRPILVQPMEFKGNVRIEAGSFIGVNAVIHPGVTIGAHAVVGASAVVLTDVPDYAVAVGNPARIVRRYDKTSSTWTKPRATQFSGGDNSDPRRSLSAESYRPPR